MRKAIFLNFPTHGCINSLLATASELVDRGEIIIYYCTEEFRDKIEQTGAEFRPYEGIINEFKIEKFDLFRAFKFNIDMTVDKLEHNLDSIRNEDPDYIIHDSICTWGKYIAAILKLPAVNLMHSFPLTESSISFNSDTASTLLKIGLFQIKNLFKKYHSLRILKDKYGIDFSPGDGLITRENLNIVYTSKYIEPNIYQKEKTYKFVGPSLFFRKGEDDFPFAELRGKKVVYISLGTLLTNNPGFYRKCVNAFLNKEYFVIISIGFEVDIDELGDIPDNFMIRQSVPQQRLLEHVDLFITSAGMNSVNEAFCYGVRMLLLPHTFEQKMIANRVMEMGLGIVMNPKNIKPEMLYRNTNKLILDSEYKTAALKYKSIFNEEEKTSHLKAADEILHYIQSTEHRVPSLLSS